MRMGAAFGGVMTARMRIRAQLHTVVES